MIRMCVRGVCVKVERHIIVRHTIMCTHGVCSVYTIMCVKIERASHNNVYTLHTTHYTLHTTHYTLHTNV